MKTYKTFWLSSKKMTISVDVDEEYIIRDCAPIVNVFKGQPLNNLIKWMRKQGGFKLQEMK